MSKLPVERALRQAKEHRKKGEHAHAQALYQQILAAYPQNARAKEGLRALETQNLVSPPFASPLPQDLIDALVALYTQGKLGEAASQAQALVNQFPNAFVVWNIMGAANKGLGNLRDAEQGFRRAAELNRTYPDAHNNLGVVLQELGKQDEAIASYQKALSIKPDYADAHMNMGVALQELGKLDGAIASYQKALSITPDDADAHNNMGHVLHELGKLDEAIASYQKALSIAPDDADAHMNLGVALKELGKLDEAIASYQKALSITPDYADAHINMGVALKEQGRLEEAIASYQKALSIKPDDADAHNNMGVALKELGKLDEAIASCQKALSIKPDDADAHMNMGNALLEQGKLDEAIASYQKALSIEPDDAKRLFNFSLSLLLTGQFERGWELYENRTIKKDTAKNYYHFDKLAWRGQDLPPKTRMLIYAEQGQGDIIQFCRYLPMVARKGFELIVETPRSLLKLISTLDCPMTLVAKGDTLPEIDAYCPIMSLPLVFRTTLETIPSPKKYLRSDPVKFKAWKEQLGPAIFPRVGLVWSGSATHKNDRNRTLRLEQLSELLAVPGIEWHSLQKEYRDFDIEFLKSHSELAQHQDKISDFSDTAALLECMDLVISVDTSVAHLAGASGKPVWVLLPFAPDWRWMLERDDSPWYPTLTCYRQRQPGDWKQVIERIRTEIERLAAR